jgi:hypothetical protein
LPLQGSLHVKALLVHKSWRVLYEWLHLLQFEVSEPSLPSRLANAPDPNCPLVARNGRHVVPGANADTGAEAKDVSDPDVVFQKLQITCALQIWRGKSFHAIKQAKTTPNQSQIISKFSR